MTKFHTVVAAFLVLPAFASAQAPSVEEPATGDWDIKGQATSIFQRKPSFNAAYSGDNSLGTAQAQSRSTTATLYMGIRAWRDGELFFNPEMALGVPFSGLTGLGGFTNGELAKTSGANPVFYRARLFGRHTWNLGERSEVVEAEPNQLRDKLSPERIVFTFGNVSALDIFDDNLYSHEPRKQFLNWSLMTHGAWDYPADARGYTWGVAAEYMSPTWSVRAGRFLQPRESNGLRLNPQIGDSYGDVVEIERAFTVGEQLGKIRLLAFRNVAVMANFQDAIDRSRATGSAPDISQVRQKNAKVGFGLNIEQAITKDLGLFIRASKHDGKTETYAFTEIDASVSGGMVLKGSAWSRSKDEIGVAFARNAISTSHQQYLRQGGLGVFLGDGNLRYAPERVAELYYAAALLDNLGISYGFQRITNPAYNAVRGPALFHGVRLHAEF